jgi:hypothetical protein
MLDHDRFGQDVKWLRVQKFRDRSRHLIQLESPLNALDALHHGLQGVAVTG